MKQIEKTDDMRVSFFSLRGVPVRLGAREAQRIFLKKVLALF